MRDIFQSPNLTLSGSEIICEVEQMKRLFFIFLILAASTVALYAQAAPAPPPLTLKAGDEAPDFTLPDTAGNKVKLSDFRGKKNVVLAFFVLAFTGG